MQPTSYWGDISLPTERPKTPLTILREQAEALSQATKGVLLGEVVSLEHSDKLGGTLRIVAPFLGGYSLDIILVRYDIYGYPVEVTNWLRNRQVQANSVTDYQLILQNIISSEEVRKAVAALLEQSAG